MRAVSAVGLPAILESEPRIEYYEDTGCEVAESCLDCPLPRCKYDDMAWFARYRRMAKDFRIVQAIEAENLSVEEAAARFCIDKRTVFRILRRCRSAAEELTATEMDVFSRLAACPDAARRWRRRFFSGGLSRSVAPAQAGVRRRA